MCQTATCNYAAALQQHADFLALPDAQKSLVLDYRRVWRQRRHNERLARLVSLRARMTPEARRIAEERR